LPVFSQEKKMKLFGFCLLLVATSVRADDALDALKQQMQQLQQQMQELQKKIQDMEVARTNAGAAAAVPAAGAGTATETGAATTPATQPAWSPAQPIPLLRAGPAYMNISFSTLVDFGWSTEDDVGSLQGGGHDPAQRGFTLPNTELTFDGAVDPYFKAFSAIVLKVEEDESAEIELEEAYLLTTALPWNFQFKAGRFFAEFGRQNQQHPHAWAFVDQPVVLTRLLGPDGLQQNGARLSWLVPTPFYTELFLGVFNGQGETAFSFRNDDSAEIHGGEPVNRNLRGPQDLLLVPRVATSFDLSDTQTLLLGASAAIGPNNSGAGAESQLYGADLYWKWRPVDAQAGFPFVTFQTEALYRRYEAAGRTSIVDSLVTLPAETLGDWGFYAQLLWGYRRGWVAGLRGEFVSADTGAFDSELRMDRTRISPNLTWYPTEFSKLRLQYNYDHRQGEGDDHSVWMQLEFLLGAHAAHKF
jgi:hypothetical protein